MQKIVLRNGEFIYFKLTNFPYSACSLVMTNFPHYIMIDLTHH